MHTVAVEYTEPGRYTIQEKAQKPLTLANDRQLKNVAVTIPRGHNLDSVLLVEFIGEF
jgi:hypothetical protein